MKRIVFLGPPGCGKGTQSKLLVDNNNFTQLSTGDLLRDETSKTDSKLGEKVRNLMESGELVPDEIVIDIIVKKVKEFKKKSLIFDGFPRNLNQAVVLDESLKSVSIELDNAIFFEINFDILKERIEKRIKESENINQRKDDNIETLINRIEVYKSSTLPIVDYYDKKGILKKVSGIKKIEEVYEEILKIIS
ncbi:MAG: adenylate kinase [Pelagibacteraceae bacterium TMED65]|nr:adenylate kinase [Rickettsiales bacterium]OUU50286.1 MAG: adenylate kinase [Pelagibacteraceae bacterium TMED65]|tara:strand:- start:4106 stop:4681 length:576 start_codon:yes stop_codon:yes gene_type:complete